MNDAMACILTALRSGPKTTLELQAACPTTHAAKPIFDARQLGYVITRRSLKNRVAEYTLRGMVPLVGAGNPVRVTSSRPETAPAPSRASIHGKPQFGDVEAIQAFLRPRARV